MRRRLWVPVLIGILGIVAAGLILTRRPLLDPAVPTSGLTLVAMTARLDVTQSIPSRTPQPVTPTISPALDESTSSTATLPAEAVVPSATGSSGRVAANGQYIVQEGDTLWNIAIAFGVTLEGLIAANPGLNPDVLHPDDVLVIPGLDAPSPTPSATDRASSDTPSGTTVTPHSSTPTPHVAPTSLSPVTVPASAVSGYVNTGSEKLRLRDGPSTGNAIITLLNNLTEVQIIGRTEDYYWLQVVTRTGGQSGWVMRQFVEVREPLANVPVTGRSPDVQLTSIAQGTPAGQQYPYISGITDRSREIFRLGQSLGNRPDVFSKVGDSITANEAFLIPIGRGDYNLRDYTYLEPVIRYFSQEIATDANSFANTSLAAKGGWSAWQIVTPRFADPVYCLDGETPLECEYRVVKPSLALIMLGTNDIVNTPYRQYEAWMREIIETSIEQGVIPVISTLPPFHVTGYEERVPDLNRILIGLAREYQIPLWDYWSALHGLPNDGLSDDGIHPNWAVPADFKPSFLLYGMTVRNLTALQVLDSIWRSVILPETQ